MRHALVPGLIKDERRGLLDAQWEELLAAELGAWQKTGTDLNEAMRPPVRRRRRRFGYRLRL